MTSPPPLTSETSYFRTARYRLFWISSLFSNMGTWMQQIAQPWILLNLTNSPFWIGLDSFALNAPSLLFTLWGGVLADVRDRRRTVLFFQGIQFLCVLVLVLLLMLGQLRVWIIVLTSFLIGLTDSLSMPSFQSIVPSLVKKNEIHKAVSLNSTQFNLSRILGPAVAGLVIVKFGALACFGSNAASYIPFFLSLYFIYPRNRSLPKKEIVQTKSVSQFLELKTFLLQPKIRLPLSVTFLNGLFCGPLITFCIVLIRTNFHEDVSGFGGAMTAFGAGGLLGATSSFLILPAYLRRNELSSALAILLSLFILAISLNHSIYLLYVLLVCTGAALTASNTHINTFLQENADNRIRGRIASLYQLAISGGLSLGALWMGFITDRFSISTALLVNGLLALLFQILIFGLQVKHIRQFTSADKSN